MQAHVGRRTREIARELRLRLWMVGGRTIRLIAPPRFPRPGPYECIWLSRSFALGAWVLRGLRDGPSTERRSEPAAHPQAPNEHLMSGAATLYRGVRGSSARPLVAPADREDSPVDGEPAPAVRRDAHERIRC